MNNDGLRFSGYAAYYEPLRPAPVLAQEARRLRYQAEMLERAGDRRAEAYRKALERFVDAFLVDRSGHRDCFVRAHVIGRHLTARYGCPLTEKYSGYWTAECGVLALHSRVGASYGGTTVGRCSVCGADDFECDHVPGRWYDDVRCHRIVESVDLQEISVVRFPEDPRCYRLYVANTREEIVRARGRRLRPREVPLCTHCTGCDGADSGPSDEDVDQSLWPPMTQRRSA